MSQRVLLECYREDHSVVVAEGSAVGSAAENVATGMLLNVECVTTVEHLRQ